MARPGPTHTAVGQLVSRRYEVLEELARGGHSAVYRGVDQKCGGEVAIKMLLGGAAASPEMAVRLVREHRAMLDLEGTSAVRALDLGSTSDGAVCLVMELLKGMDLGDYLNGCDDRGERVSPPTIARLLAPIVKTLEKAHEMGIAHRDLKPANIYVLREQNGSSVRLLDFGLAKVASAPPLTKDGIVIGSPSYIAPEVWAGNPGALDHRVDIYSLGAIIYRAMAGEVPFPASSIREKVRMATTEKRPSLHARRPDLPPEVDAWVEQVLAIEPDSRFHRMRGMWFAFLDAVGIEHDVGEESSLD